MTRPLIASLLLVAGTSEHLVQADEVIPDDIAEQHQMIPMIIYILQ